MRQLLPFGWFNARLVPKYSTIESRMCCQQPPNESLTSAAVALGMIENLEAAKALMDSYPIETWKKIRRQTAESSIKAMIDGESIIPLLQQLLAVAAEGLKKRGMQEEVFLQPMFDRLQKQKSPADVAIEAFEAGGMQGLLKQVSFKKEELSK